MMICHHVNGLEQGLAGAYLRYPVGAQQCAMAGTGVSFAPTLSSFYNPALLALPGKKNITLFSGLLSLGRVEGCVSGQMHISPRAALSVNVLYRGDPYISNLYDIDENQAEVGSYTTATTKVGFAWLLTRRLSIGLNLGIFYASLPTDFKTAGSSVKFEYSSMTSVGGVDAGLLYRINDKSALGFAISNMVVNMDWQLGSSSVLQATARNSVPPDFAAGYSRMFTLAKKPALAACDVHAILTDNTFKPLDRPEAGLRLGMQWQATDIFCIRGGLADIPFNGDLLRNRQAYADIFAPALTAGFGLDAPNIRKGTKVNYALRTDKIGAGVDQQIDISYSF